MANPKYSIIIPTKDEEESIAKVICSIPKEIEKEAEIIVVDTSRDLTPVIAKRLGAKVVRVKKKGKGRAMRKGVEKSKGEILIFLDGDGTDPAEYIPKLLKKLRNANLVLGCRSLKNFKNEDPIMREVFRIYATFVRPLFKIAGLDVSDPLAGFRAIRRSDWEKLNLKSNGFEIETEMNMKALNCNFVIKEVHIPNLKRGGGLCKSKFIKNFRDWIKIIKIVIKYAKDKKVKKELKFFTKKWKRKYE